MHASACPVAVRSLPMPWHSMLPHELRPICESLNSGLSPPPRRLLLQLQVRRRAVLPLHGRERAHLQGLVSRLTSQPHRLCAWPASPLTSSLHQEPDGCRSGIERHTRLPTGPHASCAAPPPRMRRSKAKSCPGSASLRRAQQPLTAAVETGMPILPVYPVCAA